MIARAWNSRQDFFSKNISFESLNRALTLPSTGGFWTDFAPREGKNKCLDFFSKGHPQQKGLQGQEFLVMGCLKIFLVKGKKKQGREGRIAPPPPRALEG